jgi:hypothetical protein
VPTICMLRRPDPASTRPPQPDFSLGFIPPLTVCMFVSLVSCSCALGPGGDCKNFAEATGLLDLKRLFPIIKWGPQYNVSQKLVGDIVAGLTVGLMVIPQGMAYASIAGLPPVYGKCSWCLHGSISCAVVAPIFRLCKVHPHPPPACLCL